MHHKLLFPFQPTWLQPILPSFWPRLPSSTATWLHTFSLPRTFFSFPQFRSFLRCFPELFFLFSTSSTLLCVCGFACWCCWSGVCGCWLRFTPSLNAAASVIKRPGRRSETHVDGALLTRRHVGKLFLSRHLWLDFKKKKGFDKPVSLWIFNISFRSNKMSIIVICCLAVKQHHHGRKTKYLSVFVFVGLWGNVFFKVVSLTGLK